MTSNANETGWNFENSYASLPNIFYTKVNPDPVPSPYLVILNGALAQSLGLDPRLLQTEVEVFAGNRVPEGAAPLAQAYAGHQFGYFTKLGDGRAILLGEQINTQGEPFDIQLKGAGRTPYSRGGDGRAALGPMIREYIISEAMHALGIPTTRSLAVVATGESIIRETMLPGAILTRVAASHLRVGTFEYAAKWGTVEDVRALADYAIERHYPEIKDEENRYLSFLKSVINRQAKLISKWQLVGFIHGVMNTDNMTISGETIDYGPCAFMDTYDPATVFSSIDREGRYAYGNQPYIGGWNLARFAETLLPLLNGDQEKAVQMAQEAIEGYSEQFRQYWLEGMRTKLGLFDREEGDEALIEELLKIMKDHQADFTNTFRALTEEQFGEITLFSQPEFMEWNSRHQTRLALQKQSKEAVKELMRNSNPAVIPRNHRVEEALDAAVTQGDLGVLERLLNILAKPYEHSPEKIEYCTLPSPTGRPYRTFCGT